MPTRFNLNPPIDLETFDRDMLLPEDVEHRIVQHSDKNLINAITIDTDSNADILAIENALRTMLGVSPTIEKDVPLDHE